MVFGPGCAKKLDLLPVPELSNPAWDVRGDAADPLMVGFAKQAVTPRGPVLIAGFGPMRISYGAHDDIYIRTMVVRQGGVRLALVSADLIGIQRTDVNIIKQGVVDYLPEEIVIASTHTHAGPDTLGLWGLPPLVSGRSERYMRRIGKAVASTIARADAAAVPAGAQVAVYQADPDIMVNFNEGEPEDHNMGIMVFKDQDGDFIATLLNVVGHPEAMWSDNHWLSADYPGRVCELMEDEYGGGAIFFSGALGSMMSPARPGPGEKHDFARMERISQAVFADVERGMDLLVEERSPALSHRTSVFDFHTVNDRFKTLAEFGIIDREIYQGDRIVTEVNLIEIGSANFVTFPGEAYPKQGLNIRKMQGPTSFQIGLANDEIGYILYPDDYGRELYRYETSMCAGPELATRMEEELVKLMGR